MNKLTPEYIIEYIDQRIRNDIIPLDVEETAIQMIKAYGEQCKEE